MIIAIGRLYLPSYDSRLSTPSRLLLQSASSVAGEIVIGRPSRTACSVRYLPITVSAAGTPASCSVRLLQIAAYSEARDERPALASSRALVSTFSSDWYCETV